MKETFASILVVGGKSNSLGRAYEVIDKILEDKALLTELYACLLEDDAWLRMRAADCFEKVCRQHPDWVEPYIDTFLTELTPSTQPSIQWHLAQMFGEVSLTTSQKQAAAQWLSNLLSSKDIDWIVAANAMDTLVQFTQKGSFQREKLVSLLEVQLNHRSKAVVKRAHKHLAMLTQ